MVHRNKRQRIEDTQVNSSAGTSASNTASSSTNQNSPEKSETVVDPVPEGTAKELKADAQESDIKEKLKLMKNMLKSSIKNNLKELHVAHRKLSSNNAQLNTCKYLREIDINAQRDFDVNAVCKIVRNILIVRIISKNKF